MASAATKEHTTTKQQEPQQQQQPTLLKQLLDLAQRICPHENQDLLFDAAHEANQFDGDGRSNVMGWLDDLTHAIRRINSMVKPRESARAGFKQERNQLTPSEIKTLQQLTLAALAGKQDAAEDLAQFCYERGRRDNAARIRESRYTKSSILVAYLWGEDPTLLYRSTLDVIEPLGFYNSVGEMRRTILAWLKGRWDASQPWDAPNMVQSYGGSGVGRFWRLAQFDIRSQGITKRDVEEAAAAERADRDAGIWFD